MRVRADAKAAGGAAGAAAGPSDDVLVAAARRDPAALAVIYERYHVQLFRFALARGADEDTAVDVVATTFERALANLGSYRPRGGGLPAWLFRIARNALVDEQRRRSRLTDLGAVALRAAPPGATRDPDLHVALARLPDDAREAVALRYAAGLTAAEIGEVLGKRPAAVQKLIQRTLDSLKEVLNDPGS